MEEKIICESKLSKTAAYYFYIIPIGLFIAALASGDDLFDVSWWVGWFTISSILLTIVITIAIVAYNSCKIVVTDKRVYGKASFGQRVDLPLDSISAVGTGFLLGIDIGSSSGRIHFKLIENKDEIHSVLSKLLLERQKKETKGTVVENVIATSNADELKKFKELLDDGIITQEEFDAKKKQLLGL